jgi:hypothetical protein
VLNPSSRWSRLSTLTVLALFALGAAKAQDSPLWTPIDPADLKLTENPKEPGGAAMILDYWDDTNNLKSDETVRIRIKILRDEGKKYANIEIPFLEKYMQLEDLHARTVSPDGQSNVSDAAVYDKQIVKAKRYKVNAKTLTLANVQVGSIIEYTYRMHWKKGFPEVIKNPTRFLIAEPIAYAAADWEVQRDIFVRHAHLALRPYPGPALRDLTISLPADPHVNRDADGTLRVEFENIPAFEEEEAAPPEDSLRGRFAVFYTFGFYDAEAFWKAVGKENGTLYDQFLKKSGRAKSEVERLISAADTTDQKLRKLYARAQEIRMINFEESKTEKEIKRQDLKENKNVDDVLSRNYAYANEVNLVFLAMVRAAGFHAYPINAASRAYHMFQLKQFDASQLNAMVIEVTVDGKRRFFDPATLYCPFELLPWSETDTAGVVADTVNNILIPIPPGPSSEAVIRRSAELQMDEQGNLEGELRVAFEGQEALTWRLDARNQDEAERRKSLEDWAKDSLPANSEYVLTASDGWAKSAGPVNATFHVKAPEYGNSIGQRMLVRIGFFQARSNSTIFSSARRVHPVYFRYAAEYYDDLRIVPPKGFTVEAVPAPYSVHSGIAVNELKAERDANAVHITRTFILGGNFFPTEQYAALKHFYQQAATAEETQFSLKRATPDASAAQ